MANTEREGVNKLVYQFKENARIKVSAQVAGEFCAQLERNGGLTPKKLLDASRDESAPLHSAFEWDDSVAAESWREEQAAHIIRCLVVKSEDTETSQPVRAFFSVVDDEREYKSLDVIIREPSLKTQLLEAAKREMLTFINKYKQLEELSDVIGAIETAVSKNADVKVR